MSTDDARERILAAAERCIDRHGIRKTTTDDIACEVGLSRPGVYRYFADGDELLVELISRQGRAMFERVHTSVTATSSLPDQIVETVLHIADHTPDATRSCGTRSIPMAQVLVGG